MDLLTSLSSLPFWNEMPMTLLTQYESVSLLAGAACGAIIYTVNIKYVSFWQRSAYFVVSFILGVSCAESTTNLLNKGMDKFISPAPELNKTFTAALTAAIAVRLINTIIDILLKRLADKK